MVCDMHELRLKHYTYTQIHTFRIRLRRSNVQCRTTATTTASTTATTTTATGDAYLYCRVRNSMCFARAVCNCVCLIVWMCARQMCHTNTLAVCNFQLAFNQRRQCACQTHEWQFTIRTNSIFLTPAASPKAAARSSSSMSSKRTQHNNVLPHLCCSLYRSCEVAVVVFSTSETRPDFIVRNGTITITTSHLLTRPPYVYSIYPHSIAIFHTPGFNGAVPKRGSEIHHLAISRPATHSSADAAFFLERWWVAVVGECDTHTAHNSTPSSIVSHLSAKCRKHLTRRDDVDVGRSFGRPPSLSQNDDCGYLFSISNICTLPKVNNGINHARATIYMLHTIIHWR